MNFIKNLCFYKMEPPIFDFTKINKVETKLKEIRQLFREVNSKLNTFYELVCDTKIKEEDITEKFPSCDVQEYLKRQYSYMSCLRENKKLVDEGYISEDELLEYTKYKYYLQDKLIDKLVDHLNSLCLSPSNSIQEQEIENKLINIVIDYLHSKNFKNKLNRINIEIPY